LEVERAGRKLRDHGYEASQHRLAGLRGEGLEHRQSIVDLRWRCPLVGLMTIYRNPDLFAELGLVHRLGLGYGPRYELAEDYLTT
jgi:Fe2+ or Zn2+ uptake regulation protein